MKTTTAIGYSVIAWAAVALAITIICCRPSSTPADSEVALVADVSESNTSFLGWTVVTGRIFDAVFEDPRPILIGIECKHGKTGAWSATTNSSTLTGSLECCDFTVDVTRIPMDVPFICTQAGVFEVTANMSVLIHPYGLAVHTNALEYRATHTHGDKMALEKYAYPLLITVECEHGVDIQQRFDSDATGSFNSTCCGYFVETREELVCVF